jgi:tetratricopeptide (TPR) repeat protein
MVNKFFYLLLVLRLVFPVLARGQETSVPPVPPVTSAGEVSAGWKAWMNNDQQQVEQHFLKALEIDPRNIRAQIGLAFLYDLQRKLTPSWKYYESIIGSTDNYYPYIYAAWLLPLMRENYDSLDAGIIDLFKGMAEQADTAGILKAMACEQLGEFYQDTNRPDLSQQYYARLGAVRNWQVIGPFDNISASGFDNVFPPETEFNSTQTYSGKNGVPASWFEITKIRNDFWIDFRRYFAYEEAIYYANTFIFSPLKQKVQVRIGTSGSLKAFLNDELIIAYFDENNNDLDTYIVGTELQKGWNRLLIKCGYSEIDRCNFLLRITDPAGNPVSGLEVATSGKKYPRQPGVVSRMVENFAEAYFQQRIQENPDHVENYILLAQCYLRNDKAIEAELILKECLKYVPGCALVYYHLIEAYQRGEKADELAAATEKTYSLDAHIPRVVALKLNSYLHNEQYDYVDKMLAEINRLLPESDYYYEFLINYYLTRDEYDQLMEANSQARQRFPRNWTFIYYDAILNMRMLHNSKKALDILERYAQTHSTVSVLTTLADVYLQTGDISGWEKCYEKLFTIEPAAVGYYYKMGDIYFKSQRFDEAEQTIKSALEICPNNSIYMAFLGDLYRAKSDKQQAEKYYQQALVFNRTDYDTREKLRKLQGKPSIFDLFTHFNIDSLVDHAPEAHVYPDAKGVILLRNMDRVVYREGVSESLEELLVRVFNSRGIDDFKEFRLGYNPFIEGLTIEKAVVIKKDGSEIKADAEDNFVVFKSLEENDFIYLRWKIKNYYNGKLSEHFWDKFNFNGVYPIDLVRYALLIPEDFAFQYKAQNMDIEPKIQTTADGKLYVWQSRYEASIGHEQGMPGLDDIGKILYISSIKDWAYLVNWYQDLARTKTQSSYEIKSTVRNLLQGRENLSEQEKIKLIYDYITENIRYSSVSFRQSGLIPQKARDVLVNRIGDCKDTATLCIAMLREAGIQAEYVLVNTRDEGLNQNVLPSICFNHCIATVDTRDGPMYLDLTANNFPLGAVPEPDLQSFSLVIKEGVKKPQYISSKWILDREIRRNTRVELLEDNRAAVTSFCQSSGTPSAMVRYRYRQKGQPEREMILTEQLSRDFPNVTLKRLEFSSLDEMNQSVSYYFEYEVPQFVIETGSFKILPVPWRDKLFSNRAVSYEQRKYPYGYWPEADVFEEELEMKLPAGYQPVELMAEKRLECSVAEYELTFKYGNGMITARRHLQNKKMDILPAEYEEFKKFYNAVLVEDNKPILLQLQPQRDDR